MKPIINLDELQFESDGPGLPGKNSSVSEKIGAKKLGYNVSVCPPGKSTCPYHNHRINEEMVFIIEGEGMVRFGEKEFRIRKNDFIAFPPGGPEVAHQIINTGGVDLKYLCLSTMVPEEICEYPDSDKIGVFIDDGGNRKMRKLFKTTSDVPYWEGEKSERLKE